MTIAPFDTLLLLISQLHDLDMAQEWINEVRIAATTNQEVQLNMDRRQVEVDVKREMIEEIMFKIASRN